MRTRITPNTQMWQNADQNNSEYRHFLRIEIYKIFVLVKQTILFFNISRSYLRYTLDQKTLMYSTQLSVASLFQTF